MTALAHRTRIAVHVVIADDTGQIADLVLIIAALVEVLMMVWRVASVVAVLIRDVTEAVDFTIKVVIIGIKAIAYGFG